MKVETVSDVLKWTREFHQHLTSQLQACADKQKSERIKLLLEYLSDHEAQLVKMLKSFQEEADLKALNTWSYEYLDKNPIVRHEKIDKPYCKMDADEIVAEVMHQHEQVIELYRYLRDRHVDSPSGEELLDQLISMEEHEAMRMAQTANRWHDM